MEISPTTQAILLLVSPLIAGGKTDYRLLLTPTEYACLASMLRELECWPGDLLGDDASELLRKLEGNFDRQRLEQLLGRSMQLAFALEHWQQCSIQVISRADSSYPRRLKKTLKYRSPSLLYVCGNVDLLDGGGLAVVGSRKVGRELLDYTLKVGEMAAAADCTIISGGAKGVDQASMQGAAQAGGKVIGVLANSLENVVLLRDNRNALLNEELLLCSPFEPSARFQAWQAMDRNKLIYALADAALVVQSDVGKGGTWGGATEQLEKLRYVPIYTRTAGQQSQGLQALRNLGAHSWPEPRNIEEFRSAMEAAVGLEVAIAVPQETLFPPKLPNAVPILKDQSESGEPAWSTELEKKVEDLLLRLIGQGPLSAKATSSLLKVGQRQAAIWLAQLVEAGKMTKTSRPVLYKLAPIEQGAGDIQIKREKSECAAELAAISTMGKPGVGDQGLECPAALEGSKSIWSDQLLEGVEELLKGVLAKEPLPLNSVATYLNVGQFEVKTWLGQLVKAGTLEKTSSPVRYQFKSTAIESGKSEGAVDIRFEESETKGATGLPQSIVNSQQSVVRPTSSQPRSSLAIELVAKVEDLMQRLLLHESRTAESVAEALDVNPDQASFWLDRLEEAGKLVRTSAPVRYQWVSSERQNSLL